MPENPESAGPPASAAHARGAAPELSATDPIDRAQHRDFEAARAANRKSGWYRFVIHPWRQIVLTEHPAMERFFAERCPHLAGMIAYFGILSIIPAAFLFVSVLGFAGYLQAQGWIVDQLHAVIPGTGVNVISGAVTKLRHHTNSLGVIGAIGLIWGTTNFFSCIESGLNIIYGVNNRVFIKQKGLVLVLMTAALACMVLATIAVTISTPLLQRSLHVADNYFRVSAIDGAISLGVSFVFAFFFFLSCYRFLPNTDIRTRDVWRGALIAAFFFELSIHILPLYLTYNKDSFVLQTFAGGLIVLIWFYIVSFILLAGGVYNWWRVEKRLRATAVTPLAPSTPDPAAR